MAAYLNIRNTVNAFDLTVHSQKAIEENNQITKLQYKPEHTFNIVFSKTFTDPIEYHLYVDNFIKIWSEQLCKQRAKYYLVNSTKQREQHELSTHCTFYFTLFTIYIQTILSGFNYLIINTRINLFFFLIRRRQIITTKKSYVDQIIKSKALIETPVHFAGVFTELYVAVHDLCSFKQQKKSVSIPFRAS